jgi:hypothetical protein
LYVLPLRPARNRKAARPLRSRTRSARPVATQASVRRITSAEWPSAPDLPGPRWWETRAQNLARFSASQRTPSPNAAAGFRWQNYSTYDRLGMARIDPILERHQDRPPSSTFCATIGAGQCIMSACPPEAPESGRSRTTAECEKPTCIGPTCSSHALSPAKTSQVRVIDRPPSTSMAVPDWKLDASEAR